MTEPRATTARPVDLKHVTCPQCGKAFTLQWRDYLAPSTPSREHTLIVRSCPSGGTYDVVVSCPHCDYEEAL